MERLERRKGMGIPEEAAKEIMKTLRRIERMGMRNGIRIRMRMGMEMPKEIMEEQEKMRMEIQKEAAEMPKEIMEEQEKMRMEIQKEAAEMLERIGMVIQEEIMEMLIRIRRTVIPYEIPEGIRIRMKIDLLNSQYAKIQQIKKIITETLSEFHANEGIDASWVYYQLTQRGFLSITPPSLSITFPLKESLKKSFIRFITVDPTKDNVLIRPGNIICNIKDLLYWIPEGVPIAYTMMSADSNVVMVCCGITLCLKLKEFATVRILRNQAITIVALWQNRDCNTNRIFRLAGYNFTKTTWEDFNKSPEFSQESFDLTQYNNTVITLNDMRLIIKLIQPKNGRTVSWGKIKSVIKSTPIKLTKDDEIGFLEQIKITYGSN